MQFLLVKTIYGKFNANGVLGLAPSSRQGKSFVNELWNQGEIDELKVGLNIENPSDKGSISTVTFGSWDYEQVFGGEDGLNWYPNAASSHWGIIMDDLFYGHNEIQGLK